MKKDSKFSVPEGIQKINNKKLLEDNLDIQSSLSNKKDHQKNTKIKKTKKVQKDKQKQSKKRGKQKKPRAYKDGLPKQNDKWLPQDQYNYVIFYAQQLIRNPFQNLSWNTKMPDGFFNVMSNQIKKTKDQIKTHNQRMKNKFYFDKNMDIYQFVLTQIKQMYMERQKARQLYEKLTKMKQQNQKYNEWLRKKIAELKNNQPQLQLDLQINENNESERNQ